MGSANTLEVARMGMHVAPMTLQADMQASFDAFIVNSARLLGSSDHGLAVGKPANFVLLQAGNPAKALRLRAERLLMVRRGRALSQYCSL